ncbi:MAG: M23 family metallopeptidase [Alphaproteobacteria bacterium]|nr:M23 family metallopeptidase [Alphaproteobacteria bacterium]MCW5739751.1 M23 family metallopeptidase [Alphaproteobacteria bacterium]
MHFPIAPGHGYTKKWRTAGSSAGFGADRKGRLHAGCDIGAAHGTPVIAIEGGKVVERGTKPFIAGTMLFAIAIKHDSGFVGRYTEINGIPESLQTGASVSAGQELGYTQQGGEKCMLHFELYRGTRKGSLSCPKAKLPKGKRPNEYTEAEAAAIRAAGYLPMYGRRDDVLDPRDFLLKLEKGSAAGAQDILKGSANGLGAGTVIDTAQNLASTIYKGISSPFNQLLALDFFGATDQHEMAD